MSQLNEESLENIITEFLVEHPHSVNLAIKAISNSLYTLDYQAGYYTEIAEQLSELADLVEYSVSESNYG